MSESLVRTALYDDHVKLGANIVDFHGVELPIWYSSISSEHLATRSAAGLFDVSHMGFFRFSGVDVALWLESIATQSVTSVASGSCAYTHFLDLEGHLIDDMIFAVTDSSEIVATGCSNWKEVQGEVILGVPNASMVSTLLSHFTALLPADGSIVLEDLSPNTSILALQGPASPQILAEVLGEGNVVRPFTGRAIVANSLGINGWIQGTGYTGERGFEIFVSNDVSPQLWRELLKFGIPNGLVPVGLGARDTLRLERGFLLSGQDFLWPGIGDCSEELPTGFLARNSWHTNVPFGLDMGHDFLGKAALEKSINSDTSRLWGIKYLGKGPLPRPGKRVVLPSDSHDSGSMDTVEGDTIGYLTSGAPSPSLGRIGIGMGYLQGVDEGDRVLVVASPRKMVEAIVVRPPFI
jgi:aminomethyltransferase